MSEQHKCCYASTGESNPCYYCQSLCKKPQNVDVDSKSNSSLSVEGGGSDVELPDYSWCDEVLGTNQEAMRTVNSIIAGLESEPCDSSEAGASAPSGITVTIARSTQPSESSSTSDNVSKHGSYQLQIPEYPAWTLQDQVMVHILLVAESWGEEKCEFS